jgi:hypothetical protein
MPNRSITPGTPCLIKYSVRGNEGKIVTAVEYFPNVRIAESNEQFNAWRIEPQLGDVTHVQENFLFPLRKPGDDEEDMFPLSKNMTNNYHFDKSA